MSENPSDIKLSRLPAERIPEAARMAARAMAPDPMSAAIFGPDGKKQVRGLDAMFQLTLITLTRPALIASKNGQIVGIVGHAGPRECIFKQMEARRKTITVGSKTAGFSFPKFPWRLVIPTLRMGFSALSRISAWTEAIGTNDPTDPHQHIELVAVDPNFQRQGIGRLMMEHVLQEMRDFPAMPYLETNTEDDVNFYERFGFEVLGSTEVGGATTRFMGIRDWGQNFSDAS